MSEGLPVIDIATRDCDVPLSEQGKRQALALGRWFKAHSGRPHVILSSPYLRATQTATLGCEAAGWHDFQIIKDERLREKEFGILDRLTTVGIAERYPEQAEMRGHLGKFYFRPPGGESWTDVILRLRSVVDTMTREYRRERVVIVAHQIIVLAFRYLFERLTEEQILEIDRQGDVANCSVTRYRFEPSAGRHGKLVLADYNLVAPLEEAGEAITRRPDEPVAPK